MAMAEGWHSIRVLGTKQPATKETVAARNNVVSFKKFFFVLLDVTHLYTKGSTVKELFLMFNGGRP